MERRSSLKNIQSDGKQNSNRNEKFSVIGLIIAAGLSSRMGEFKPLLKLNNNTFISNILNKLHSVCNEIIVVTGHNLKLIESEIEANFVTEDSNIRLVHNQDYKKGMFTSIKKGVEQAKYSEWILFHQVDQPNLSEKFYFDFVNQINTKSDWIQPIFNGKRGHPIIFGKKVVKEIISRTIDSNLRVATNSSDISKKYWECNYPEILTDLDTPADLINI